MSNQSAPMTHSQLKEKFFSWPIGQAVKKVLEMFPARSRDRVRDAAFAVFYLGARGTTSEREWADLPRAEFFLNRHQLSPLALRRLIGELEAAGLIERERIPGSGWRYRVIDHRAAKNQGQAK